MFVVWARKDHFGEWMEEGSSRSSSPSPGKETTPTLRGEMPMDVAKKGTLGQQQVG